MVTRAKIHFCGSFSPLSLVHSASVWPWKGIQSFFCLFPSTRELFFTGAIHTALCLSSTGWGFVGLGLWNSLLILPKVYVMTSFSNHRKTPVFQKRDLEGLVFRKASVLHVAKKGMPRRPLSTRQLTCPRANDWPWTVRQYPFCDLSLGGDVTARCRPQLFGLRFASPDSPSESPSKCCSEQNQKSTARLRQRKLQMDSPSSI